MMVRGVAFSVWAQARWVWLPGAVFACAAALASPAWANVPAAADGPTMPLPLAVELKKVPVGSWSEYRVENGESKMTIRMALVARTARGVHVETQIKGGPVASLGRTTVRLLLPLTAAAEIQPQEQVMQLGDNPPMVFPNGMAGGRAQTFRRLDPKERVGVESVTVAGGTFPRADHYRKKGSGGETVDFWVSTTVLPFGLIKVTSVSAGGGGTPVLMELASHGAGAKPAITKAPVPFDAATVMAQTQAAMGGGGGGGAAPSQGGGPLLRPVPSPHPGMPPVAPRAGSVPPPGKATVSGGGGSKAR